MMKIGVLRIVSGLFFVLTSLQVYVCKTDRNLKTSEEENTSKIDSMQLKITVGDLVFMSLRRLSGSSPKEVL
jgi:hypothetical protein